MRNKPVRNKARENHQFKKGDIVRLVEPGPLPGYPEGGYFLVEETGPPFFELSIGSIKTGIMMEAASCFRLANGHQPDWAQEEIFFQRSYCSFLKSIGQPCPHCEAEIRKKEAKLEERQVH